VLLVCNVSGSKDKILTRLQRFAPIIDYFEVAVDRLDNNGEGSSTRASDPQQDTQYQYQRALALSNRLKDQIYVYSNEQMTHLQNQSMLL
jgi:hypothetical protein